MKKKLLLIFVLSFISTKPANAGLFYMSEQSEHAAIEAIKENDLEKLKAIVKKNKSNVDLIDAALPSRLEDSERYVCRTEIVKYLMDVGYKPQFGHMSFGQVLSADTIKNNEPLTKSVYNLCSDILEMFIPKANADDVAKASFSFSLYDLEKKVFEFLQMYPDHKKDIDVDGLDNRIKKISDILNEKNKKYCKKSDPLNRNCDALKHIENEYTEVAQRGQQRKFEGSHQGILANACDLLNNIKREQGYIETEKSVGRTSGYVDKSLLHESGSIIVQNQKELSELKKMYAQKTGKSMPLNQCKKE